jgi:CheY-like chemotaxis protein
VLTELNLHGLAGASNLGLVTQLSRYPLFYGSRSEFSPGHDGRSSTATPVVLIIIHDLWRRRLIEQALSSHACKVLTASNGVTGLRLVQREHPDVVILELNLPELAGALVIEDLQRRHELTRVIVVDSDAVNGAKPDIAHWLDGELVRLFGAAELLNQVGRISAKLHIEGAAAGAAPLYFSHSKPAPIDPLVACHPRTREYVSVP